MLLILIDTSAFSLAVPLALGTDIISEHGAKDKILFGRELVQWAGHDETDGFQAFLAPKIHVQVLLSGRLQQVWNTLTLQPFNGLLTILFITGEQHHVAHTFVQFVDVVHQHLERCVICCCRSHFFRS